ncbi:hypothetical protein K469DRAFT_559738, partial [Zopfia rhizophila CBS 207.26]
HHSSRACAIGGDYDPNVLLDSGLPVRDVVEVSAFSHVPGSFPLIAIFMLSEKANEAILSPSSALVISHI